MKIVTLKSHMLSKYLADPEMLRKSRRPCVIVLHLTYKGSRYDFAVPIRSNISPSTPKDQYFPLPPRKTTRSGYRHGIHYSKMFPVDKRNLDQFRTAGNPSAELMKSIIDRHEKEIISECESYLKKYEAGFRPCFATNIDLLISLM